MPKRPSRPCNYPSCPNLAEKNGYCTEHLRETRQRYDRERGTANERGYTYRWAKIRKAFLIKYPLCHDCLERGEITAADEVHHITPLAEGGTHNFDNLMALCKSCHSKRTMKNCSS
jgi:5-methylcytosine-specific restriction protein A